MRLLTTLLVCVSLAALGACGGDDSSSDSATTGTQTTTTTPTTAGTGASGKSGSTGKSGGTNGERKKKSTRKSHKDDVVTGTEQDIEKALSKSPVRRGVTDKAAESDKRNLERIQRQQRREQLRKSPNLAKLPPKQRAIYASAAAACQIIGPAVLKQRYKAKSSKPKDLARAYANKTVPGKGNNAAYEGCLDGLAARG